MGPNGSGKSTLAYAIAGHPKYTVTGGTVTLDGEDVLAMSSTSGARAGVFLAMQYPVEVPGVSVSNFLRTAGDRRAREAPKLRTWVKEVKEAMTRPQHRPDLRRAQRQRGFSGGEKKRHEILQLELLKPASRSSTRPTRPRRRRAARGLRGREPGRETGEVGVLLITHYTRILRYIRPDFVHVFIDGRFVEEGGPSWPSGWRPRATSASCRA
jgi:Fe-S cluster assembly ATP-binding protein